MISLWFCFWTWSQAHGSPEWLQPTYNLETQLSQLIGDYYVRKREGMNNLWIIKPWNMARTIDTTVTDHLPAIIRLMETGPKICQKYIERPALFQGRKFDLRYIVLVRSISPLELFLSDVFWVCRFFIWFSFYLKLAWPVKAIKTILSTSSCFNISKRICFSFTG